MSGPRPGSLASRLGAATSRAGATVLVIEDEPDIATFLGAFFRASGLELAHLDPVMPGEVVAAVLEHRPACLLLDLRLRGFSGLDVLAQLRSDKRVGDLPVVVFSGDGSRERQAEVEPYRVAAFVTKPFNVKALYRLVSGLVQAQAV